MNAGVNTFNTKFSYFNCEPDSLVKLFSTINASNF